MRLSESTVIPFIVAWLCIGAICMALVNNGHPILATSIVIIMLAGTTITK